MQKREPARASCVRSVPVVDKLSDEVGALVVTQFAGPQVHRAVEKVQKVRTCVELIWLDEYFTLRHREHAADSPGIKAAAGEILRRVGLCVNCLAQEF